MVLPTLTAPAASLAPATTTPAVTAAGAPLPPATLLSPSLGALGEVVVGGAEQSGENRASASAAQEISPPSYGDPGLAAG